jgi:hypothetical protein
MCIVSVAREVVLVQLKSEALKAGLDVNANKTNIRVVKNSPNHRQDLSIDRRAMKKAECLNLR